jgi:arsenate reductase
MKKVYYLSTCSTCQRILAEWKVDESYELQDIKTEKITPAQIDTMISMAGSAAALFSKRALKYRAMGLHERELSEKEMRQLILDEYTFLSRPVLVLTDSIFVGNAKKTVDAAKVKLASI